MAAKGLGGRPPMTPEAMQEFGRRQVEGYGESSKNKYILEAADGSRPEMLDGPMSPAEWSSAKAAEQTPHGAGPAQGEVMPEDITLLRLGAGEGEPVSLATLMSAGRPLILNFGSCS